MPNSSVETKHLRRPTWLTFNTKEIALIAVLSAIWITSEIYLGYYIGEITHVYGITERLVGWFLMLVLAKMSDKFGRVTTMAIISATATRVADYSYVGLVVGLGYVLGGLIFDLLFFIPYANKIEGKNRNVWILTISVISGIAALIPYLFLQLSILGIYGFIAFSPLYAYSLVKGTVLSFLGTFIGLPFLSQIKAWRSRIRT